jgi:PAS domain S-box-containing protein
MIAVFGFDQNVHIINLAVASQRFAGIVFIGIICLGVLLVFIYRQKFSMAERHSSDTDKKDLLVHWGMAIIVGLFGLTVTVFVFMKLHSDAWDLFQTTFQQRAMSQIQNVSQEIQRQLDRLDGLCRFMGSDVSLEREAFNQYVTPFLKDVPVQALVWVPRVKNEQILFYESVARQDGIEKYRIYEKDAQGKNIPVSRRDEYFPVYYVQPWKGNDKASGFDMASEPIRRAAMQKSCDTGLAVATVPLLLVQGSQDRFGFLVFLPVYAKDLPSYTTVQRRKSLRGFVLGVFGSQEFLKGVYSRVPTEGLACLIEDPMAPKASQVLYRHKTREGKTDWNHPVLKYKTTLGVADRQWQLTIIPSTAFIERNLSKVYWWVLLIGLLLTGLMAALLNILVTARYRADNLVKLRTLELNKEKELLRKREETFHLILDSTAEAIYGIDLNGNCSFCNPSCLRMLGYDHARDLLGKNMHLLLHHSYPDGRPFPREKCQLYLAFKNNLKIHVEEVFWRRDGTSFPAEVWSYPELREGKLVGAVVSFWNITERKNAEETLRKREAYLTSILDNFPHLVWLKDTNGRFLAVNNVFAKACGRSVKDVIGKTDLDVWPQDLAEKYQVDDNKVMQSRSKSIVEELMLNEGIVRCFETYRSPIFDSDGTVMGTLGFSQDITERRSSEDALKRAKDMAERAVAVKDEFTSTVSHELRTPLSAIKSSIDILDTEVPGELTRDQKIFIKRVKSNVDRLARLINDVLDLSKLESGKMVMNLIPLRPDALIQEVVETQIPLVKSKGLTITTEFGENLPSLVADKDRLIQVLNNLINNALKFTQEGGIVVAVHVEDKEFLKFSVRDTGVGIIEEDLPKLFQKFQQVGGVSQQVAGTGLGLAICKNIVEKHHGLIWVESQFGRGSSFNFVIPVRKEKRILIVDDDEGCVEVLKKILEAENVYEIEAASDGFWANQKYYEFSPQVLVLDINIPKINGLELCTKIKRDPKIQKPKIIVISSFDSEQKKKEAWDAGADEIINKPINPEEFIAKLKKLIQ